MADHDNVDDDSDALRCQATASVASRDDNKLRVMTSRVDATAAYDATQRRHGDVIPTSAFNDDIDDVNWSTSRSRSYPHQTTGGWSSVL